MRRKGGTCATSFASSSTAEGQGSGKCYRYIEELKSKSMTRLVSI